jgi:glycosyltransferase involved in cell wall biosynthesis
MDVRNQHIESPYFSICIPQHNRTSFLLEALKVLSMQKFRDFEICIADDCSTDGREQEIIKFLEAEGVSFAYRKNDRNLRYDGNLRASIALARGRYCFLHGNDDCLKDRDTLSRLHSILEDNGRPGVALTNFECWKDGFVTRRVHRTELFPSGPETAATHFRNVAFVTGVMLDRALAQSHETDRWDGSEMYQMFLMARIISLGGRLLELDESFVRQNIEVPGEVVNAHARAPKIRPCPIVRRTLPMDLIGRVIADGIKPGLVSRDQGRELNAKILLQLYLFTYPRWIIEYRKIQSWKFALGVAIGQSPKYVCQDVDLTIATRTMLAGLHLLGCSAGLVAPTVIYDALKLRLHVLAKTRVS